MRFRLFILFFLLQFAPGFSQELPPPPISARADSAIIYEEDYYYTDSLLLLKPTTNNIVFPKNFDVQFQAKYKGSDFDYTTVKPRESLLQKIKKRISKILEALFGKVDPTKTANYADTIMWIVGVVIGGFLLYFLINFLLGKDGNFFFSKKKTKTDIYSHDLKENIHEINFNETIEQFERQNDYRSAVRYQFLLVLKKLADKKLITWNPEKTNKDYLSELKSNDLKTNFKELAYIFDYVWYGEFEVEKDQYNGFKQKFTNFKI